MTQAFKMSSSHTDIYRFLSWVVILAGWLIPMQDALSRNAVPVDTSEAEAARAVVERLFDGMRAGDSTTVRSAFHPNASMHTVAESEGGDPIVRAGNVDDFVAAVGRPHTRQWDERTFDVEVRVDGHMASAWVPYAFYLGDEFSHCGVNSIQLVRTVGGAWKILQILDTRHTTGCNIPASVANE
jgi:hypothetical protein